MWTSGGRRQGELAPPTSPPLSVRVIKEKTGERGLWGIVNNAGWATFGEVEWVGMDTYRRALDINVLGLIQGIQTVLPLIRKAKGRVVTITSGLGVMAVPTRLVKEVELVKNLTWRSPYCLTKYALEGFHDVLRYEMKPFGVEVSAMVTGYQISGIPGECARAGQFHRRNEHLQREVCKPAGWVDSYPVYIFK